MNTRRLHVGFASLAFVTVTHFALGMTVKNRPGPALAFALPAALVYIGALTFSDRLRIRWSQPLTPLHWLLLVFGWLLVVQPFLIAVVGPSQGALPFLPSAAYQDLALVAMTGAFVACWAGLGRVRADSAAIRFRSPDPARLQRWGIGFLAAGMFGLALRFDGLDGVMGYYAEPWRAVLEMDPSRRATVSEFLSTILRPFLPAGAVLIWAGAGRPSLRLRATLAVSALMLVVGSTYSFNRAAMVVPLVALAAASAWARGRIRHWRLAGLAFLVAVPMWLVGHLRSPARLGGGVSVVMVEAAAQIGTELQVYGGAPQFGGFLIQQVAEGTYRGGAEGLVGSLLYPIPVIGKRFRERSGVALYNNLIYGTASGTRDQVVPFVSELWVAGGPLLMLAAFYLVGVGMANLDRRFAGARNAFEAWAAQYAAIWLSFLLVGSLAAVAQVFVFFGAPILAYLAMIRGLPRREGRPCA